MALDERETESRATAARADADVRPHSAAEVFFAGLVTAGLQALNTRDAAPEGGRPLLDTKVPAADGELLPAIRIANVELPMYEASPPESPHETISHFLTRPGALGEFLELQPPGERLARLLEAVDTDEVDDYSLVEVAAAYKRLEAWSAAKSARAAAALADRESVNPTWPGDVPGRTRGECVVGQELAMRLRVSKQTAVRQVAAGRAFGRMFQPTGEALEQGLIDFPRALAIVTTLEKLPSDVAMAAQLDVLAKAPGRTLRQVQGDLAKAVIAVDPDGADSRHRTAREERKVNRPRPLPDGMALVSAVLPAGDAIALDTALEAAARSAKNAGDGRTLDQLRADCLAFMGHAALAMGFIGAHPAEGCRCGCPPPDAPPGAQPAPPSHATPSCTTGAASGSGAAFGISPTHGSSPATVPPHPGRRLQGGALPMVRLGMLGGGRSDIRITIPLHVLLPDVRDPEATAMDARSESVAELEGYGPVPPVIARALAEGGVWRRLVTDPLGDRVLDVGRTSYQPPAAIADHVRERDRTCVRPGCSAPARGCDLDHIHEWQHGGVTSAQNLGSLCKADHVVKSIGAFTVAYGSDRTYAWTTPTGHGYLRRPDGTTVSLPRRTAHGLRTAGLKATRTGHSPDTAAVDAVLAEVASGTDAGGRWEPRDALTGYHWPGTEPGPSWDGDDEPPF